MWLITEQVAIVVTPLPLSFFMLFQVTIGDASSYVANDTDKNNAQDLDSFQ